MLSFRMRVRRHSEYTPFVFVASSSSSSERFPSCRKPQAVEKFHKAVPKSLRASLRSVPSCYVVVPPMMLSWNNIVMGLSGDDIRKNGRTATDLPLFIRRMLVHVPGRVYSGTAVTEAFRLSLGTSSFTWQASPPLMIRCIHMNLRHRT